MKRVILVLFLAAFALGATKPLTPAQLVARLTTNDHICTAWHFKGAIFITASHCVHGLSEVAVNGERAVVLKADETADLAALFVTKGASVFPVWALGSAPVEGDQLRAYGYGTGVPLVTFTRVIYPSFVWPGFTRPWLVVWGNFVAGMSGGPIVNARAQVVSVVQAGFNADGELQDVGLGATNDALWAFTADYH